MNRSLQSLLTLSPVQLHNLNKLQSSSLFLPCISAPFGVQSQCWLDTACPHKRFYHPPDRLKVWKPTSPGQRHRITVDRYNLWKGGGHKRLYRRVDFWRKDEADSVVKRIEYDPNRGARIALVEKIPHTEDQQSASRRENTPPKIEAQGMRYIIAPAGVGAGDVVSSRSDAPIKPGMTKRLKDMPTGTTVHNVELMPGKGAVMCRAAGTSATLVKNGDDGRSLIALPSGEQRMVWSECKATVGVVSNSLHVNRNIGKAGISRHMGIRPTTRAIATNPYDHPLGGKAKKNRKTPWGKVFMGVRTRNPNKKSHMIHLTRHAAKALVRK